METVSELIIQRLLASITLTISIWGKVYPCLFIDSETEIYRGHKDAVLEVIPCNSMSSTVSTTPSFSPLHDGLNVFSLKKIKNKTLSSWISLPTGHWNLTKQGFISSLPPREGSIISHQGLPRQTLQKCTGWWEVWITFLHLWIWDFSVWPIRFSSHWWNFGRQLHIKLN